jgi:hypothetical protein
LSSRALVNPARRIDIILFRVFVSLSITCRKFHVHDSREAKAVTLNSIITNSIRWINAKASAFSHPLADVSDSLSPRTFPSCASNLFITFILAIFAPPHTTSCAERHHIFPSKSFATAQKNGISDEAELEWKVNKTETETKSSYDNVESRDCESLALLSSLWHDAMANTSRGKAQEAQRRELCNISRIFIAIKRGRERRAVKCH